MRWAERLLRVAGAVLTLFLFLLNFNPIGAVFVTDLLISNRSAEKVVVTPLGIEERSGRIRQLPLFVSRLPLLPAVRTGAFELEPGGSIELSFSWDDVIFSSVVVVGPDGAAREQVVDADARVEACCYAPRESGIAIAPFEQLPPASAGAQMAAGEPGVNFRVLILYLPLLGPLALAGAFALRRRLGNSLFGK